MPRFSIIVPAYQVQSYLGACLDSVLEQSYRDFELIGVDDRSPDGCGEILDGYAARDERVRVLHLPENVGLGRARNAGIEAAGGEYLIFLDGDDTLTEGSLRAIADRLDATGEPEVLVYDYARTYWDGRAVRSRDGAAGAFRTGQDRADVFTAAEREDVLNLLMVVWNKAYRRDFVERNGFRFPAGYYEDTPWTYPVMLTAATIATLDRVVVHYRQRRQGGNILATVSRRHFDIFAQYDLVFDYVHERPELHRWLPLLHARMVDHLRTVGNHPDRVPAEARREFHERAAEAERRHRPEGAPALTVAGDWRHGPLGRLARTAGRTVNEVGPKAGRAVAQGLLTTYQAAQRRLPLDRQLALFSSYGYRPPACNPAAIQAKLRELAPGIKAVWVVDPAYREDVPEGLAVVSPGSREYREAASRATWSVSNVPFDDSAPKRQGMVYLQTHCGTPVKRMGTDLRDYPAAGSSLRFNEMLRRVDDWDYSLSANHYSSQVWERVYPSDYRTLEYGYPRNDVYATAGAAEVLAAREELGVKPGQTVLLYAPTTREYRASYRPALDPAGLVRALGPDHVLLYRAHFLSEHEPVEAPGVIDVTAHPSVERLALAADALITDYSSLMVDYANLDRPIVLFADDREVYRQTRGTYLDLFSGRPGQTPGATAGTEQELTELLRSGEWRSGANDELRGAFRERFCAFDDGRAAERVVRTVFLGEATPLPVVPLAERTTAPRPEEL